MAICQWRFAPRSCASSLPGDVIARYHRLKGNHVVLVSGTDCHGTPIDIKALKENKSPKEIVDACHNSFSEDWKNIGLSYNLYNRTDDPFHKEFVQNLFKKYYEKVIFMRKKKPNYTVKNVIYS